MSTIPKGVITFGPRVNCNLDNCPVEWSILGYQPALAASGVFIGLIGLSMIAHFAQGFRYKTWGFMWLVVVGCLDELVGYAGRVILHGNPFSYEGFLIQIICVTTAPVFFCAAVYIMLSKTIEFFDRSLSRFNPRLFYWIFIPCDVVSLILQAAGGAISCLSTNRDQVQRGVNISLAGLVFQVVTLTSFCALFVDYLVRCKRSPRWNLVPKSFKIFLAFLFLSILFIFIRCAYRVKELSEGYFSEFFRDEPLFIALESAMMVLAILCLNVGHPGIGFRVGLGEKEVDQASPQATQLPTHEKNGSSPEDSAGL